VRTEPRKAEQSKDEDVRTTEQDGTLQAPEAPRPGTFGADDASSESAVNGAEERDLASVTAERDTYLDQLQRSVAEFANYRRRVDQERTKARELATRDILTQLLPIMDDLKRALENAPDDQVESAWVQGVQFIEKKLTGLLERSGVSPIEAVGQPFDPAVHEAVATEPGSSQNFVVEVYQTGYKQGEQVLRPAMVKVGNAPV
jgi:molecular chaperone GrpE